MGFGTRRECFGDGFGTYQGRGCLEKQIFPLLWDVRFRSASVTGVVRGGNVSASAVGNRRYYAGVRNWSVLEWGAKWFQDGVWNGGVRNGFRGDGVRGEESKKIPHRMKDAGWYLKTQRFLSDPCFGVEL